MSNLTDDQPKSKEWHQVEAENAGLKRKAEPTTDAVKILHKRYVGDDPERQASLQRTREEDEAELTKREAK